MATPSCSDCWRIYERLELEFPDEDPSLLWILVRKARIPGMCLYRDDTP
jgi:hypothetical protein